MSNRNDKQAGRALAILMWALLAILALILATAAVGFYYFYPKQIDNLTEAPQRFTNTDVVTDGSVSFLALPVSVNIAGFQEQLEREFPRNFNLEGEENNIIYDCDLKRRDIQVSGEDDFLKASLRVAGDCDAKLAFAHSLSSRVRAELSLFAEAKAYLDEEW